MIISNREFKFSTIYKSSLSSEFWKEVGNCYSTIHQLPAVLISDYHYDFAKIAAKHKLGIFPGPTNRLSESYKKNLIQDSRNLVRIGSYDKSRLYVFREANQYQLSEFELDQNLAINNLGPNDRAGFIDGFLVVAPNVLSCDYFYSKYEVSLPITSTAEYQKTSSEFDLTNDFDEKYLLNGWSETEEWGTWTEGNWVGMFFQLTQHREFKHLVINGHGFRWPDGYIPNAKININGVYVGDLKPRTKKESEYIFLLENIIPKSNSYYIEFIFEKTASPAELAVSDDTRKLGFMFKEISLK
jgi:hypothetical protein